MTTMKASTQQAARNSTLTDTVHNVSVTSNSQTDLIDEHLNHILTLIILLVLQIPVLAFGIVTNILNIVIFRLSGLRDSVSITFTALSISDLGYVIVFFTIGINALLWNTFHVQGRLHLSWLSYFVSFYGLLFQDVSVVITMFVAIQKCCCVAIPHLFKNVFNAGRTIIILIVLCAGTTMTYAPLIFGMRFITTKLPMSNDTLIIGFRTPLFMEGLEFWMAFNKIILPASSQGISLICLIVMTVQLKKSSKFRSSATAGDGDTHTSDAKQSSAVLGYKERRALTAVALVLVICMVATLPAAILKYGQLIAKEFFSNPRYHRLLRLFQNSQNILVHVSASINIFIYLKYNSKYRETAVALIGKHFYCFKNETEKST